MQRLLEKALEKRKSLKTEAFRYFSGAEEGIPGLVIEVFGAVAFFQLHEGKCALAETELVGVAVWCGENLNVRSVYLKRFVPDRSGSEADPESKNASPFWGEVAPEEFEIEENGLKFRIRPYDGLSVGLFLDQRNNREVVGQLSQGKTVLNLFSYTCGFSIACARYGALVTSIDTSKKYLEWGRRNFEANQLSSGKMIAEDVLYYLEKQKKKGTKFDVVILDPPSFGRSEKGTFSLKKDWKKLLTLCLELLESQGMLFFSSNLVTWESTAFRKDVVGVLKALSLSFEEIEMKKPLDFSFQKTQGLNQICIRLKS